MASFLKWGRVLVAAGSVALLSVEAVHLESSKIASAVEETKRSADDQKKNLEEPVKAAAPLPQMASKAPNMAPQFDGLNFYETFISAARR